MPYHTLIYLALLPLSWALPDGPPLEACRSMQPGTQVGYLGDEGHLKEAQNVHPTLGNRMDPPFYIQVRRAIVGGVPGYNPEEQIMVSVVANQSQIIGGNKFKGVLLQAREVRCADNFTIGVKDVPIGHFETPGTSSLLKTLDCGGLSRSAVGHRSNQFKINETIAWKAPGSMMGHLIFKATVVKNANEYWMNVYSPILKDPNVQPPPRCGAPFISVKLSVVLLNLLLFTLCEW